MALVNLCPHDIVLRDAAGVDHTCPSVGTARVTTHPSMPSSLYPKDIPVPVYTRTVYGSVVGLPDPVPGTYYIVSALVAAALGGTRSADVLCPGTGPSDGAVRHPVGHERAGQVIAVTRLVQS